MHGFCQLWWVASILMLSAPALACFCLDILSHVLL